MGIPFSEARYPVSRNLVAFIAIFCMKLLFLLFQYAWMAVLVLIGVVERVLPGGAGQGRSSSGCVNDYRKFRHRTLPFSLSLKTTILPASAQIQYTAGNKHAC
jgi:hypothetical protein